MYFSKSEEKASYFETKGLGLGILRNDNYKGHVSVNRFDYNKDDVVFLYTDGITEAKDSNGREFGYERLQEGLEERAQCEPIKIQENLIERLYEFTGDSTIDDDYTTVIIKFK